MIELIQKKILVITPRFPYPTIGGDKLRIFRIAKELSKKYSVDLLSLCETKVEMDLELPEDGVFNSVDRIHLSRWKSYTNTLLGLIKGESLQVAYYSSKEMKERVDESIKKYDLVLCHLIRSAEYVRGHDIKKVLEMTDAISLNYSRIKFASINHGMKSYVYRVEQKRVFNYERKIVNAFDVNVLVSEVDRRFLFSDNEAIDKNIIVCSNGVDLDNIRIGKCDNRKFLDIVFIGNMHTLQNLDAAFWFANNVLPELRKYGNYRFKVIGKIADDNFRTFNKIKHACSTGTVESIADELEGAFAGICSVRVAAGVQNKILEYMASGLPTITTSEGLEGLQAVEGVDILVANSAAEFANKIVSLSNDKHLYEAISSNGVRYVTKNHAWDKKLTLLMNKISEII